MFEFICVTMLRTILLLIQVNDDRYVFIYLLNLSTSTFLKNYENIVMCSKLVHHQFKINSFESDRLTNQCPLVTVAKLLFRIVEVCEVIDN